MPTDSFEYWLFKDFFFQQIIPTGMSVQHLDWNLSYIGLPNPENYFCRQTCTFERVCPGLNKIIFFSSSLVKILLRIEFCIPISCDEVFELYILPIFLSIALYTCHDNGFSIVLHVGYKIKVM